MTGGDGHMPDKEPRAKVIIGLPAYNEEKALAGIILQAKEYADEVIVVDDGSTDRTSAMAGLAGAIIIRHENNRGKGAAIQTILAEARKHKADTLCILDADGQHDPEEIPRLLQAVSKGSDLVIGQRVIRKDKIPGYRYVGQRILSYFTRRLAGGNVSDTESGFRAFSKKAIDQIHLKETGFAVESEMISEAERNGLNITEVPISIIYTKDGSTLNPIRHGFGVLNRILVMISEKRPLLFFSVVGGILLILGLISGIGVLQIYYSSRIFATGSALLCMLLVTLGMLCIFTGVILNVITKRLDK